jgi:hypothetical protein
VMSFTAGVVWIFVDASNSVESSNSEYLPPKPVLSS